MKPHIRISDYWRALKPKGYRPEPERKWRCSTGQSGGGLFYGSTPMEAYIKWAIHQKGLK